MFTIEEIQSLNELEMQVYQYVIQHKSAVPYMRIRELAAAAHVSTTPVLRFCKKMGCHGYSEFKMRLKDYIGQQAVRMLPAGTGELRAFFEHVESDRIQEQIEDAAAMIAQADRVVFVGIGNSGHIGRYGARYFTNLGKLSFAISDPFYPIPLDDTNTVVTVAIILSVSGETAPVLKMADSLKQINCRLIAITNTDQSMLSKMSDISLNYYITLHHGKENVDYSSQVPALFLIESLAKQVSNRLTENEDAE